MLSGIRTVLHPEWYHGRNRRPPFFEGWYFKVIDATEGRRYAVIPGIFLSDDPRRAHAFVQILDGISGKTGYETYPISAFEAARGDFEIAVGPNRFSARGLSLDLKTGDRHVVGTLRFQDVTPWPVTWRAPGIMGWYGWLPFMECYHGVLSFDHALQGSLTIDGTAVPFDGGRGYIEKDWGQSFPSAWIWFQSNHFTQPGSCVTGSVARIPWGHRTFRGLILGLWHAGRLHRFATYTGARTEHLALTETAVSWVVRDRTHRIEIAARRVTGGLLRGPDRVEMGLRVPETLQAAIEVRLSTIAGATTLFHDTGRNAGLEVAGDLPRLLQET